jgi:tetratricopeptide (TPR) repeat protein
MISPGCSFTFDGLKQTLLSVAPGIESKLKEVHHLVINYRTTKDILVMANAILDRAKQAFPGAIEYALPETAVKDLGLRVVTCSWKDAMQTSVKFGQNQVYIYSPSDSDVLPEEARQWLNGHPFILSSLDSKGLEFDDVVVAFDMERKIWDISRQLEASLRLLRELYVAVTRAQRRVVILMKSGNDNMKQFFHDLGCEEMSAESILQEFNHETTTQQWYERGLELFESERFKIAANCFTRAEHPGWAFLANGKQSLSIGNDREAENCFRKAVQLFHERQEYDKVLDLLKEVLFICTDWDPSLDSAFETAFSKVPKHLPRNYAIEFNLKRDRWNLIRLQDLSDPSLSDIFSRYRGNAGLNEMVQSATDEQRLDIESLLPWAHADFHVALGNHMQALKIFLTHGEIKNAETCSERLLHVGRWRKTPENCQVLVALWKAKTFARTRIGPKNKLSLLLQLFMQPEKVAFDSGSDCIRDFGRDVIRCAFDEANIEYTALLSFKDATFNSEVTFKLQERFHPYYSHVVEWLVDSGHGVLASDYARKNDWSNDDLFRLALAFRSRPKWLLQTLQQRKLLNATSQMILCSARLSEENKKQYRSDYESSFSRPIPDELERFDFLAVFTAELERFDFLAVFTASGPVLELKKSGMWVELAFIYGYLGFYHVAMVKSVQALQSESKNVSKVLRLWEEFGRPRNDLDPTIVRQRILIKLLDTMNTKVTYGHDGDIVTCDMERLAFSLEPFHEVYSDSEEEIDYWRLVQKFDPTVAAYSRLCFGAHDESLLESLAEHYTALTALLSNRRCSVGDGAHACAPKLTKQPSRSMPTGPTTNQNQPKNKGGENKKKRRNRKKKRK